MVKLSVGDRKRLIKLLANLPAMSSKKLRRNVLENAGLGELASHMELTGTPSEVASEIVSDLVKLGRFTQDGEALGLFLSALREEPIGVEAREIIDEFLVKYDMLASAKAVSEASASSLPISSTTIGRRARPRSQQHYFTARNLKPLGLACAGCLLVIVLRWFGFLQPAELFLFDCFMRMIAEGLQDPRILVVEISESDREYQLKQGWSLESYLSDEALEAALQRLIEAKAGTIGISMYRHSISKDRKTLISLLESTDNLFCVCKVGSNRGSDRSISRPPYIPLEQTTFSNFIYEKNDDSLIRRQILTMDPPSNSSCKASNSLALILSLHYLETQKNIKYNVTKNKELYIGNVLFRRLRSPFGGYQKFDDEGYQILLNYRIRNGNAKEVVETVTLQELLEGNVLDAAIAGKIVIVGRTADSLTPWRISYDKKYLYGPFIHALMVNQILSTVLNGRPLIWAFPIPVDIIWIFSWTMIGGVVGFRNLRTKILAHFWYLSIVALLWLTCFSLFYVGGWAPLLPSLISLTLAYGITKYYSLESST